MVNVPARDFSIAVSPSSRSVKRGTSTTYSVTVTRTNGFTGTVSLSVSGQTATDVATFSPTSIGPAATTSVLTVQTASQDPRTTRTLVITGTSGSLVHSATTSLTLR
jgi:hypothetical protein